MKIIHFKNLKFIPASHEEKKSPGVLKKILLQKKDLTKGYVQMINWAKLPQGKTFKAHYHQDMEEIFIILSGRAKIKVGKKTAVLKKGDTIIIPPKNLHQMKNISKEKVEYIAIGISQGKGGKTIVI
ncbi:MAG: cupin domain-containing protein [Patescibacteria group bacterium]